MPSVMPSYGATSSSGSSLHGDSDQTLAESRGSPKPQDLVEDGEEHDASEESPLIQSRPDQDEQSDQDEDDELSAARRKRKRVPWVLIIALSLLCVVTVLILFGGFLAPEAAQEYAKQALDVHLGSISVDSFTPDGVRIRAKGQVKMDASKVKSRLATGLGIFVTSVARKVKLGSSTVRVSLPDYPKVNLGSATYPDIVVDLRNGHITDIDIISDVIPGSIESLKPLLDDYVAGKIKTIRVQGEADIPIRSGILPLGTHYVTHEITLDNIPDMPPVNVSRLNLEEIELPNQTALGANVSVSVKNDYPIDFDVPAMGFSILLVGCNQAYVEVATAKTAPIKLKPYEPISADVQGVIKEVPFALVQTCPGSKSSPLDEILDNFLGGKDAVVYVRGLPPKENEDLGLPAWLSQALNSVTVPVPFPSGKSFDNLLKSFDLTDVKFKLPSPFADDNTPESMPRLSATVRATIGLPEEMNAPLDVSKLKTDADIYYKKRKLGEFHIPDWVPAKTTQHQEKHELEILARVTDVPLNITDSDTFSKVIQKILFGDDSGVELKVAGTADVMVDAAKIGAFAVRGIPANGSVVIKGGMSDFFNYDL